MSRNKPQVTRPQDITKIHQSDLFETPPYALTPLMKYLPSQWTVWEPAAGSGRIVRYLQDGFFNVIASDLDDGKNFFDYQPDERWDVIITNPPYSIKFQWLERCYELGKPFALLVPLETIGSSKAQKLIQENGGLEMMLFNSRIDFHTPNMGWSGGGAQFPAIWLCHKIFDSEDLIKFADITKEKAQFKKLLRK
jgi:hypothetical protein